jgi:hypothetical protein
MPLERQWERQNTPLRRLTRRERRILALVAIALVLGGAAAIYASVTTSASRLPPGCIEVTGANGMGAGQFRSCGAGARQVCASQAGRDDVFARAVQAECRRSAIPSRR